MRGLRKLRSIDEIRDQENRLHLQWRRRRGRRLRRPRLPEDARAILGQWRAWAEFDPSHPDLEPRLIEVETGDR